MTRILLLLFLSFLSFAQGAQGQNMDRVMEIRPGFGAEYFDLTIGWDEDTYTSKLRSYIFSTNTQISLMDGLSFHLILGYALSNFDDLTFRELPFSVELGVKELGGIFLGTEFNKRLFSVSQYEINLLGQFVYYYGFKNEWEMPGLNVEGTVTGSPSWMRAQIGPYVRFEGFQSLTPFFCAAYNKLWGTFKMDQDIQGLIGTEKKRITGKNNFSFTFGAEYELSPTFFLKGALSIFPYDSGVDVGGLLSIQYVMPPLNRRTP